MGGAIGKNRSIQSDLDLVFTQNENQRVNKNLFSFDTVLKTNTKGTKFWKTKHKYTKKEFLLTQTPKIAILNSQTVKQVLNELEILKTLNHPFIPNLRYAFHDPMNIFMGFDYLGGGNLSHHLKKRVVLPEFDAKFIIACILSGLEYLHQKEIIHGNITPDNLTFNMEGYIHLCDFKMAKKVAVTQDDNELLYEDFQNDHDLSYSAPEFLLKKNIGKTVDYYSVGIIAYEMMVGGNVLKGKGRKDILTFLNNNGSLQVKKSELPEDWSFEAADFINRLIQRRPENRLGYFGFYQIKSHPWLKDFPWQKIGDKTFEPPYKPPQDFARLNKGKEDDKQSQLKNPASYSINLSERDRKLVEQSQICFTPFNYDFYKDNPEQDQTADPLRNTTLHVSPVVLGNLSKLLNIPH